MRGGVVVLFGEFYLTIIGAETLVKEGMDRYRIGKYGPDVLHDLRTLVCDPLRISIERYICVSERLHWRKLVPLRNPLRGFYAKFLLQLHHKEIVSVDDGVLAGAIDPDTYTESGDGLRNKRRWLEIRNDLFGDFEKDAARWSVKYKAALAGRDFEEALRVAFEAGYRSCLSGMPPDRRS